MKSGKVWLIGLSVVLLLICFSFGTAHSQDLSGWVGKWFKLTVSLKGYKTPPEVNYVPETNSNKVAVYLNVTAWDTTTPADPFLSCSGYHEEDGNVVVDNLELHYLGGLDFDFLCRCVVVGSEEHDQFIARITGKESEGILKSAKFKTVGGFYWERSSDPILNPRSSKAGGITITGSLIAESKLPSWIP